MKNIHVIVEGMTDKIVIQEIFKAELSNQEYEFKFYAAGGFSNALSCVKPALDLGRDNTKVLLLFDSDTTNESKVRERMDFVKWQINFISCSQRLGVYTFVPSIESLFPEAIQPKFVYLAKEDSTKVSQLVLEHLQEILTKQPMKDIFDFIKN